MNSITVSFSERFYRSIKELRKKYRHIQEDVDAFALLLEKGETPGDRLQGSDEYVLYKARIASQDMQRGKSGGFRVIYYLQTTTSIMVINIYAKPAIDNVQIATILQWIHEILDTVDDDNPEINEP